MAARRPRWSSMGYVPTIDSDRTMTACRRHTLLEIRCLFHNNYVCRKCREQSLRVPSRLLGCSCLGASSVPSQGPTRLVETQYLAAATHEITTAVFCLR
jgi:hypothetical protein